jgi:hypothetical protein
VTVQKSLDSGLHPGIGPFGAARLLGDGWSAQLSLGFLGPIEVMSNDVRLRFTRLPLDVGFGWPQERGDWLFEPMALLALDHFIVFAPDLEEARPRGRFELGPRIGFRVSRSVGSLRAFGLVDLSWFPRDYSIQVDPVGSVRATPHWWAGARFGLALPIRGR